MNFPLTLAISEEQDERIHARMSSRIKGLSYARTPPRIAHAIYRSEAKQGAALLTPLPAMLRSCWLSSTMRVE